MPSLYDRIGATYTTTRAPDPRLARAIRSAIGDDARTLVNVGAGAGAYEPRDLDVIAVEPSATMRAQRPPGDPAHLIDAHAERLPLADDSVDVALTVFSDHHWSDRPTGLRELARVARRRVVLVNADPALADAFWLTRDYLPAFHDLIPAPYRGDTRLWQTELKALLGGGVRFDVLPIPHDCTDGFYAAYWRRPEAYLDPAIRDNISIFRLIPHADAIAALRRDLDRGAWHARHAGLLGRATLDVGLRVVVAELG
jgi:SAM-dependent methyltransferase